MLKTMKRGAALLMALVLCLSLLPVTRAAAADAAVEYVYDSTGKYIYNWGTRGEVATSLSPNAEAFYTGDSTYDVLSVYKGGTGVSDAPQSALYAELQTLMKTAHSHETSYAETRDLYQYTDCQNSGKDSKAISSFYSGKAIGPAWDGGATWNREHTWPNSKGVGGNDENDIMMLRPTASTENGARGNMAYGEGAGYFDPNADSNHTLDLRGDVARIFLYTYVRWGVVNGNGEYDTWGTNGVIESLEVLLKWMELDPVDTWELGRNDSVQAITGTRNVFVDYPELAFLLYGAEIPGNMITPSGEAMEAPDHTHNFVAGTPTPATCTAEGYTTYTCTICGKSYKGDKVPMLSHNYKNGVCTGCGAAEPVELVVIENPVAGTAYKFGMIQKNVSATDVYYLDGGKSSYYMSTTKNSDAAIDVYLEKTTGGYYFYTILNGTKTYINMVVSGTHVNGAYEATASTVYSLSTESKTIVANVNNDFYWFGTRNDRDFTTVGPCATSYNGFYCQFYGEAGGSGEAPAPECKHTNTTVQGAVEATCTEDGYTGATVCSDCGDIKLGETIPALGHNYVNGICSRCGAAEPTGFGIIDVPAAGTAYKFGMIQQNVSATDVYYLAGGMSSYYMATTTDKAAAIDVYLEETAGGYYFYTMINGVKTYINMVVSGTHVNGAYEAKASTVYTYDAASKTIIAQVNNASYWFGTRNDKTYTTVGPCATSYNGFYCQFYGERGGSGETPAPDVPEQPNPDPDTPVANKADFETINSNGDSGYNNTYTTKNGWKTVNSAIQTGGSQNSNPQFTVIGPDKTYKAVCMNGKTSAPGKITSPTLTGGISKLTMRYTKMFTDTKLSATITITDLTTGTTYTKTVARDVAKDTDKYVVWDFEWVLETPVVGDFTIEVVNNCPSKSTSNKDRLTVLELAWASAEPECKHTNTTVEGAKEATCTEDGHTGRTVCADCGETVSEGEVIPAPGHSYENGVCANCGEKDPDAPAVNRADFETIVTSNANGDSSYTKTFTTKNGWKTVNSAIQAGGPQDNNPQFTVIGPDNTHKAVCMNGKTSAPGKITSPTLTGGISKLTMRYTKMFTDTKLSATITITDLTTGATYTKTVARTVDKNADKYVVWDFEWILETPVVGDFTIEVVNDCPSKSTSNKDRLTVLELAWVSAEAEPECKHTNTTIEGAKEATCSEDGHTGKTVCADCGETVSEGEVIPAPGHSYENGVCANCGAEDPDAPAQPDPDAPAVNRADFETIVTSNANGDSSYTKTFTTKNGWKTVNSAIQAGGPQDNNPQFTVIGPDNTHKAVCMNGKTSAPGKITSPTLTGGISKLTMRYTKMFTDTKLSATITITDLTTGATYTKTVARTVDKNADKYVVWDFEWILETPVVGDFTIEVVNDCPSKSTSNKDRLTVLELAWVSAEAEPECKHTNTTIEGAKEATCTEDGHTGKTVCADCGETVSKGEVIPALDHDLIQHPAQAPTYSEIGWEAYETCSRCDYSTYVELPVLPIPLYTITVTSGENGKVTAQNLYAAAGTSIKVSAVANEGYKVLSLTVTDAAGKEIEIVDGKFKMPASKVTVSATFIYDLPYTDVADDAENYDAIAYMYENGLMIGTSTEGYVFDGDKTMTRAQIAMILYRLAGEPETACAGTFTDAPEGTWYTEAVEWAASKGIINGVGDDSFAPGREITVVELAALTYRYAQCQQSGKCESADWATESAAAMTWCVENGVLSEGIDTVAIADRNLAAEMFFAIDALIQK